jgi:phosphatidylserine/phosphatidylglycerophosphate/cardiolipin synthase-like enzyme
MAKKANSPGTLSSHWCPPTDVLADGVGEPVACMASTFEFDAAFFETELLPRFLGLRFDHTENELTFLIEREEKLALAAAAVLVDVHKVDPGQTTLRWDQVSIAVPGSQSIQHSKITVLAWERLVRLIVGSANITRQGYRRNREVFATLDFYDDPESSPHRLIADTLSMLDGILAWARVPVATRNRTRETLSLIRDKLASWTAMPEEFRPREQPRVTFIATCPALGNQGPKSAFDQDAEKWGSQSVLELTVVTPFVGNPDGEQDKVVQRLSAIPRSRECVGWLVAPRHPAEESDPEVQVALPQSFGASWQQCFESRGGGCILAIPQFVKGVDKVNRVLHSKMLSLESAGHQFLMIGSSNFSPHGMGVGVFNVEANLLFEDADGDVWDRIDLPVSWDEWNAVDDVHWDEQPEPAEDCIDEATTLPRFFVCASYSQVTGELQVTLDRSCPEPSQWAVRLRGMDADDLTVFSPASGQGTDVLTHTFPEASRSASLAALLVEWTDDGGQPRQARLIVSIASKDDLVASEQFRAFGVDVMIDCLVHGRSLAEWQERQANKKALGNGLNDTQDSLRAVDTSGYLLYQVRRFGRAMSGLCERLERVVLLPTAVRYRVFKDPLGPLALAEALTNAQSSNAGSLAALSDQHRLFLLAELLLSVAHTIRRLLKQADKKSRKWLKELVREAIGLLAFQVSSRKDTLGDALPANMSTYVAAALKEASDLIGPLPTEVANAS